MPFHVPDGTEVRLTTTAFLEATVNAAEKPTNPTWLCVPARKIAGQSGRGRAELAQTPSPEAASASASQVTGPASLEVLLTRHKKRRNMCKAFSHLCLLPNLDSQFLKGNLGCRRGWWHSTAVSICTALGLWMRPWKPRRVLGCIKSGEGLTIP